MKEITWNKKTKLWQVTWNNGYKHFITLNGNELATQYKLTIK